jgi:hypothetical protein
MVCPAGDCILGDDDGIAEASKSPPASDFADRLKRGVGDGVIDAPSEPAVFRPSPPPPAAPAANPFKPQPASPQAPAARKQGTGARAGAHLAGAAAT